MARKNLEERRAALMPNGIPRYIRIWDKPEFPNDRYTCVFTKKTVRGPGDPFLFVSMNENGDYYHGELAPEHFGKHLGKRVRFEDLPEGCKRTVLTDYRDILDLNDPEEPPCTLAELADGCATSDHFISEIQRRDMVASVYAWEHSTPENERRFKHTGWFGIASAYFDEQKGARL